LVRCGLFASDADCAAYYDRAAIANPNTQMELDQGKIKYDDAAAKACVDAFASLSCDSAETTGHELDVCDRVYVGTAQEGAVCVLDGECVTDNCVRAACPGACCMGTCGPPRTLPGPNMPCSILCAEGAYCGVDSI